MPATVKFSGSLKLYSWVILREIVVQMFPKTDRGEKTTLTVNYINFPKTFIVQLNSEFVERIINYLQSVLRMLRIEYSQLLIVISISYI